MKFIGLDPGNSSGSIVVVAANGEFIATLKLPKATVHDLVQFLREHSPECPFAVLERVSAMPKQGVSSSFKFGTSYGQLQAALAAAGIPFEEITPGQWQAAMRCRSKGDKNVTKAAAQRLHPGLKVTHGTADGLLLAEYARRLYAERMREVVR